MNKILNLTYASSLTNLCEINSSFDTGILRIAYTGKNRNGSSISKASFEKCLKTIYNCPIVCNYNRETDTIGGHDMKIVRDNNGEVRLVNLTVPIGCIPESAKTFWKTVTEADGTKNEYLCVEALLWKRQEAYQKIKKDGCVAQSMEITVKDGAMVNGVYEIYDFEFTAFALIGVEPCFESAALEFSKNDFKQQVAQMMQEAKEIFNKFSTSIKEDDDINQSYLQKEGGKQTLNAKLELLAKYEVEADKLDFSIENIDIEELEERLKAFSVKANNPSTEDVSDKFKLESNICEELRRILGAEKIQREWGECRKYFFVDYDKDASEVYCWDNTDDLLYGFPYTVDGDMITIDYNCKKRKKYEIVDFVGGESPSPLIDIFETLETEFKNTADFKAKYEKATNELSAATAELEGLRRYKADMESSIANSKKEAVLNKFTDLIGNEQFDALKDNADKYDVEELEEKCFAIRGRTTIVKFSQDQSANKSLKVKLDKSNIEDEPYGGLFLKYNKED